jgi:type 1 glutamine amidotransferase
MVNNTVKILMTSGSLTQEDPYHPWRLTSPQLKNILESNLFDVKLIEDYSVFETEAVNNYDVILLDHRNNFQGWNDEQKDGLLDFVKGGGGLVTVHASIQGVEISGGAWITGMTSHDNYGVFTVEIMDKKHPIAKDIVDFEICDELWYNLELNPNIHVIAGAKPKYNAAVLIPPEKAKEFLDAARERNKGKPYPVAWTLELGKGRVFHTTLGHVSPTHPSPIYNVGFIKMVVNAIKWTAGSTF